FVAHLVVACAHAVGRTRNRVLDQRLQRGEERLRSKHIRVPVKAPDGRVVSANQRAPLLLGGGGQKHDQACCRGRAGRVSRYGQLAASHVSDRLNYTLSRTE